MTRTQDESLEEEINPAHYNHLWDHHDDLVLHPTHHAFHHRWIRQHIPWAWCNAVAVLIDFNRLGGVHFQVFARCECCDQLVGMRVIEGARKWGEFCRRA